MGTVANKPFFQLTKSVN